ncbi:hypothetical protein BD310DRAFT_437074 [Dichomitus squalens]|uniref:Secreted protein n=1 Tax=Dichomitus squalens TaxID=114155 RepID=A0A4Q9PWP8_9APHY|nr:hypothetical protein BD310DRAFT_437074 [Dichomitus squalens]
MAVCRCLLLGALPKTLRATDCFDEPWLRQTCDNLGQRSVHRSHVRPQPGDSSSYPPCRYSVHNRVLSLLLCYVPRTRSLRISSLTSILQ